jgi:hypothetical protein
MAQAKTATKAKAASAPKAARPAKPAAMPKTVKAAGTAKARKEEDFSAVWDAFLGRLSEAGQVLADPRAPHNQLDQTEGVRYLARLTRAALEQALESADPDFPRFFQLSNETIKIGADNPDNIYWNAVITGNRDYRVWGNRGDVPYLTFGTKENRYGVDGTMISTGELDAKDMKFSKDGSFEIIISRKKQGKNWLPSTAGSTGLIIRQTFTDKTKERPGAFNIEAIDAPAKPKPITQEDLTRALNHTAAWVTGTAKTFADWSTMFMEHPNQILARDQKFFQRGGGDPNIFYGFGYYTLADDEAWVIETEVPKCRLWNFQLCNWWMESLDYRTIDNVWTNQTKAKLEKDGTLKIVVAKKNPGLGGNWLDSTGHTNGVALLRWVGAKNHPVPKCSVVKMK